MKKINFISKLIIIILLLQSCEQVNTNSTPACEWEDSQIITFTDLQLHHPVTISGYHSTQIPPDKIERHLVNILLINGDAPNTGNSGKIFVNTTISDGCVGTESKSYSQFQNLGLVGISNISEVPIAINGGFSGEATVKIETDVYHNQSGGDSYYHIYWEETRNDPNGYMVGNIIGEKITHINVNGTNSIVVGGQDGYVYSGGEKNYL